MISHRITEWLRSTRGLFIALLSSVVFVGCSSTQITGTLDVVEDRADSVAGAIVGMRWRNGKWRPFVKLLFKDEEYKCESSD